MPRQRRARPVELYGLKDLLDTVTYAGGRHVNQPTKTPKLFENLDALFNNLPVSPYGSCYKYAEDVTLLADDTWIFCCTVSSWGGTFQSHDDVYVKWYHYTPRS